MTAIFGADKKELFAEDTATGQEGCNRFLNAYKLKNRMEIMNGKKAVLHVGDDDWPFPVPVIKTGKKWRFDTPAGKEEILSRRIGQNETASVQVCLAYVDAQEEYAQSHRAGGLPEYARRFSSKNNQDYAFCSDSKEGE